MDYDSQMKRKKETPYSGALRDCGICECSSHTGSYSSSGTNSGKYNLGRHKAEIATAVVEAVEAPIVTKFLYDLKGVASNRFVEAGLKMGKLIKHPIEPRLFPWPHIAYTGGQIPMDPSYENNPLVVGILNASRDPVIFGSAVTAAILGPLAVYGGYKSAKHAWPTAEKNVGALSSKILPEFAHERLSGAYKTIKKRLGK